MLEIKEPVLRGRADPEITPSVLMAVNLYLCHPLLLYTMVSGFIASFLPWQCYPVELPANDQNILLSVQSYMTAPSHYEATEHLKYSQCDWVTECFILINLNTCD